MMKTISRTELGWIINALRAQANEFRYEIPCSAEYDTAASAILRLTAENYETVANKLRDITASDTKRIVIR